MTKSKALFLKDSDTLKWWIGIVHDPRFDKTLTYARAALMEQRPTGEQMIGCELTISTLETLVDSDAAPFAIQDANIGLDHNLTQERTLATEPKTTED